MYPVTYKRRVDATPPRGEEVKMGWEYSPLSKLVILAYYIWSLHPPGTADDLSKYYV